MARGHPKICHCFHGEVYEVNMGLSLRWLRHFQPLGSVLTCWLWDIISSTIIHLTMFLWKEVLGSKLIRMIRLWGLIFEANHRSSLKLGVYSGSVGIYTVVTLHRDHHAKGSEPGWFMVVSQFGLDRRGGRGLVQMARWMGHVGNSWINF